MHLLKTPLAQADLIEIWQYIALDNLERADTFLEELKPIFQNLLQFPLLGRDRSILIPNMRSFPFKNYVIFYRVSITQDLEIIRVLHAARDTEYAFEGAW